MSSFAFAVQWWDHNENMYIAAASLLLEGKRMYLDFAYFQMPYLPYIYWLVFALTGTTHYLLVARIVNWTFWLGAAGLLFILAREITRDRWLPWAACCLFMTNRYALRIVVESSNYVVPLTFALAALASLLAARRLANQRRPFRSLLLLSGVFSGLSVGTKLYYAATVAPLLAATLFIESRAGLRPAFLRNAMPMAAGLAIGLLPAALALARDPEAFLFNNLYYHALAADEARMGKLSYPVTFPSKLSWLSNDLLTKPSSLLLIFLFLSALLFALHRHDRICRQRGLTRIRRHRSKEKDGTVLTMPSFVLAVTAAVVTTTVAAVLYMTPLFPQYVALPLPYAILAFFCTSEFSTTGGRRHLLTGTWLAVALCLPGSGLVGALRSASDVHGWPPVCIHERAEEITALMNTYGLRGRVATLEPLLPIEGGATIYPEFATGVFAYRIGYKLSPEQRRHFVVPSADTIGDLFTRDPPAAILLTTYPETLQGPLRRYAEARGYHVEHVSQELDLYLRVAPPAPVISLALGSSVARPPGMPCHRTRE